MTARLPVLKPKQVIKALERAGFYIHRQSGSHARLIHKTDHKLRVTVATHNKDIKPATFKSILKQANLTPDEFRQLL